MPSFKCTDVGMDCRWTATAKTEEKLMGKIKKHAKKKHDMGTIDDNMLGKIKSAIS